jgi:steroid delta-isomerase
MWFSQPKNVATWRSALLVLLAGSTWPAAVQPADPAADIRAALSNWTEDFNAGDKDKVCAIFAPDLRYDYRGFPERGFADICATLQRSLSDPAKHYAYTLTTKEILVAGDLAVVRLVWRLKVTSRGGREAISEEPGMDVFRRQPDGSWKIIRYIAYEKER